MSPIIGAAADFYRLRVTRVDEPDEADLEWRDDILYRKPPEQRDDGTESFAIEAVGVDDEDDVRAIALYGSTDEAYAALEAIQEDLDELTKSAFESRYFAV